MSKTRNDITPPIGAVKLKGWAEYLIIIRERWLLALTLSVIDPLFVFLLSDSKTKDIQLKCIPYCRTIR